MVKQELIDLAHFTKSLEKTYLEFPNEERWKVYRPGMKNIKDGYYYTLRFNGRIMYSVIDQIIDGKYQLAILDNSEVIGFKELEEDNYKELMGLIDACKGN